MRTQWRSLLAGALAIAFLSMLMQLVIGQRLQPIIEQNIAGLIGEQRLHELQTQAQAGAIDASKIGDEVSQAFNALTPEKQDAALSAAVSSLAPAVPVILGFGSLILLLSLWARSFFLATASQAAAFGTLVSRATRTLIPLIVIGILIAVYSGVWLPFLCLLFLPQSSVFLILVPLSFAVPIVFLPRFVAAPLLLLRGSSVLQSVHGSWRASAGYWGKIVGNVLVATAFASVMSWALTMVLDVLAGLVPWSGILPAVLWASWVITLGAVGYRTMFLVDLSAAILAHPRAKKA